MQIQTTPQLRNRRINSKKIIPSLEVIIKPPLKFTSSLLFFSLNREMLFGEESIILFVEAQDHRLRVHLVVNGKVKIVLRNQTLTGFLRKLSIDIFKQCGRSYIINVKRLTGASPNRNWIEFDHQHVIHHGHGIAPTWFRQVSE
jgi:hypothetical protein